MSRVTSILSVLLVVGSVAWLIKVGLIVANGGTNTTKGIVGIMFVIGIIGLLVGSSSLGLWLARRQSVVVRIISAIASVVVFWLTFGFIDEAMPSDWLHDETGILVTALIWLGIGIWLARTTRSVHDVSSPAPSSA